MRVDDRRIAVVRPDTLMDIRATRIGDPWWRGCRSWLAERR